MRISFLTLTVAALVASSMTAASAFNYASMSRAVGAAIVTDDGQAYLYVQSQDTTYACLVEWVNGKVNVNFDGGTSCSTRGTGVNPDSTFYFRDVIKITNKGSKDIAAMWLNMTDTVITTKTASSAGTEVTTSGWSAATAPGALTMGSTIYVSFKVDTDTGNLDTGTPSLSKTLTIEARAAN